MKGRPRKTLEELRQMGAFRPARHADRIDEPQFDGVPVKPRGLDPIASKHWDAVVPDLVARAVVKGIDAPALTSMCILWSLFQKSAKKAEADPTDKLVRSAITGYHAAWVRVAASVGLTPADRARLSIRPPEKRDGILSFAAERNSA